MFFYCLAVEDGADIEIHDNFESIAVSVAVYLHKWGVKNKELITIDSKGDKLFIYHNLLGQRIMIFYVGYEDGFYIRDPTPTELWELGRALGRWFNVDVVIK